MFLGAQDGHGKSLVSYAAVSVSKNKVLREKKNRVQLAGISLKASSKESTLGATKCIT